MENGVVFQDRFHCIWEKGHGVILGGDYTVGKWIGENETSIYIGLTTGYH